MSNQPSLVEASRPDGLVVDETGEFAEHHDHGAVYSDGEYDLEGTVDVLEERFSDSATSLISPWSDHGRSIFGLTRTPPPRRRR
ncbi:hypothetical protein [Halorubrum amylolyticum]|uniref:hypothetical protein n=1 Tax=Halorubrum amylolyticum TaxID=2508724 RepID=UPI0010086B50|nr:hypothetical protein [Halorubrum amylolyticum]